MLLCLHCLAASNGAERNCGMECVLKGGASASWSAVDRALPSHV
jgi:hypothetical protein